MQLWSIRGRNAGGRWTVLAGLLFVFNSSCATMVRVPEEDYVKVDPSRHDQYRLVTNQGGVYEFTRFAVTDSTIVILEVVPSVNASSPPDSSAAETPVVVQWYDVKSLERGDPRVGETVVATLGVICVGGAVLSAVLIALLVRGIHWGGN
jgi:hypothetical protein